MLKSYDLFLDFTNKNCENIFTLIKKEFIFRLNPHWIITDIDIQADRYSIDITDHASGNPSHLSGQIVLNGEYLLQLSSDNSEWKTISFFIKSNSLHAEVLFATSPTDEQERFLVLWLRSIKEYLRLYLHNSINTRLFRMVMNKVILQMTPSQRKICLMLIRLTVVELVVILLILVGWFFFFR